MDLMVSVMDNLMSVEFVLSTRSYSASLVRMAPHRVSNAIENETNVRLTLFARTLVMMVLYRMLSRL